MSSAINGNMWYLSRGYNSNGVGNKHVFSVCLDKLISQSTDATSSSIPSPWQTLADTSVSNTTLLVVSGALLTVGGFHSSAIHHYQPSSSSWVKVGDLPIKRWQCACTVLPSGDIFVAGGHNRSNKLADSCLDIATLHT